MSQINIKETDSPLTPATGRTGLYFNTSGQPRTIDDTGATAPLAGANTFLELTDAPSVYTGQANKFVRVNATPDALAFDTVSPFDLDQEGATDGQVLAWSTANSRFEPTDAGGGGSSLWTDATTFIYRDGPTQIGKTSSTEGGSGNNITFLIQSKFDTLNYKMIQHLSLAGDELFFQKNNGISYQTGGAGFNVEGVSNIAGLFRSNTDTSASVAIRAQNQSGTTLFTIDGNGLSSFPTFPLGVLATPITNFGLTVKSQGAGGGILWLVNSTGGAVFDIINDGTIRSATGAYFGSKASPSGRVNIRGTGTTTGNTLLLEDSAGTDNVRFLDNGNIDFLRLPTSDPLVAGRLWNDTGTVKISAG